MKPSTIPTMPRVVVLVALGCSLMILSGYGFAQSPTISSASSVGTPGRPVTIPLTVYVPESDFAPELQRIDLTVSEDGEPQTILSIRAIGTNSPLTLAVLIQDDVVSSVANEMKPLADFIRRLPRGSRVMVGSVRVGSLQVRQKFTTDLEKASRALRPPVGLSSLAPYNPYVQIVEAIRRFESQPSGRRAILIVSDGLDTSRGIDISSSTLSLDLQRAINEAQRHSVAVYGFYAPTVSTVNNSTLSLHGQSSLLRLAGETGGRAFFQGTGIPVGFDRFIRDLNSALQRQIALTYLSTHPNKGFHRVEVRPLTPGVRLAYPPGYTR